MQTSIRRATYSRCSCTVRWWRSVTSSTSSTSPSRCGTNVSASSTNSLQIPVDFSRGQGHLVSSIVLFSCVWCASLESHALFFFQPVPISNKIIRPHSILSTVHGSCSIMHKKYPCGLDLLPMTLKFSRVLEVVDLDMHSKLHQVVHELSTVH